MMSKHAFFDENERMRFNEITPLIPSWLKRSIRVVTILNVNHGVSVDNRGRVWATVSFKGVALPVFGPVAATTRTVCPYTDALVPIAKRAKKHITHGAPR
jgi:hypothetical protein